MLTLNTAPFLQETNQPPRGALAPLGRLNSSSASGLFFQEWASISGMGLPLLPPRPQSASLSEGLGFNPSAWTLT